MLLLQNVAYCWTNLRLAVTAIGSVRRRLPKSNGFWTMQKHQKKKKGKGKNTKKKRSKSEKGVGKKLFRFPFCFCRSVFGLVAVRHQIGLTKVRAEMYTQTHMYVCVYLFVGITLNLSTVSPCATTAGGSYCCAAKKLRGCCPKNFSFIEVGNFAVLHKAHKRTHTYILIYGSAVIAALGAVGAIVRYLEIKCRCIYMGVWVYVWFCANLIFERN